MSIPELKESVKVRLNKILNLRAISSLLEWDQEVYMPPKGADSRAKQLKVISELIHQLETDQSLVNDISQLLESKECLTSDEVIMFEEALYDIQRKLKIPLVWVGKFAEVKSQAYHSWVDAREKDDFSIFAPHLEKLVDLLREEADYLGYEGSPYNALLENYERGMTIEKLDVIFNGLLEKQSLLYKSILSRKGIKSKFYGIKWDEDKQKQITLELLNCIGFDFSAGRQDVSVHPFTTNLDIWDVRITTRFSEENLFSGIYSTLHECGHALYEQGFRIEDRGTWLAQAPSYGIHEAMSRFWENIVGRSFAFCKFIYPILKNYFSDEFSKISPEDIYEEVNQVKENFIRVEADECSYNLHIILRYIIEKELIHGKLSVQSVPERWNVLSEEILGLRPPNNSKGCLQDIHWSHGSFGYFPSYALGNLFSVQIAESLKEQVMFEECVERGDFAQIREWLKKNIYDVGRRLKASEIVERATHRHVSFEPFINYLYEKYSSLYNIPLT